MVQFNLLPDVKIKYIKARRQKRLVIVICSFISAGSLAVFGLAASYVYGIQGTQISSVNSDISKYSSSITSKNRQVDDFNKVLTIQNQLEALDTLHGEKPVTSRLFDYLSKLTPSNVTISNLTLTLDEANTLSLQGSTDTIETINKFVDTIKFTTYKPVAEGSEPVPVFTDVVLVSFGRDRQGASYTVSMSYDPVIFKGDEAVTGLSVPLNKTTTRSELGRPIFQTETEKANNAPEPVGSN